MAKEFYFTFFLRGLGCGGRSLREAYLYRKVIGSNLYEPTSSTSALGEFCKNHTSHQTSVPFQTHEFPVYIQKNSESDS